MRSRALNKIAFVAASIVLAACGAKGTSGFAGDVDDAGGDAPSASASSSSPSGGSSSSSGSLGSSSGDGGGSSTTSTTVYANTDDALYSMDPKTHAVTLIGKLAGVSGSSTDKDVTDCAVNANGDVYVNTMTV